MHVGVAVPLAITVGVPVGVPQFTGSHVGMGVLVLAGRGVLHAPFGQFVGVGVAQTVPGAQVGVDTVVDVGGRVYVGSGVLHPPLEQPVGDGLGVTVAQT